jgi:hypothetical protein
LGACQSVQVIAGSEHKGEPPQPSQRLLEIPTPRKDGVNDIGVFAEKRDADSLFKPMKVGDSRSSTRTSAHENNDVATSGGLLQCELLNQPLR